MRHTHYSRYPSNISWCIILWCAAWLASTQALAQCEALSKEQMQQALMWSGQPKVGLIYKVHSWYVQDGDSVRLPNGHRLRLGLINTTEMASKGRPAQAYSAQAKETLALRLQRGESFYLKLLPGIKDHYGRWLTRIYDDRGLSAEEMLIAQGLAYAISMDEQPARECLWQQDALAQGQGLGLWNAPLSQVYAAQHLTHKTGGFLRLTGKVRTISESKTHWYVNLSGDVALKITKTAIAQRPSGWVGQNVQARGWLAWRKLSKKQYKKGYKAGLMTIYNRRMLEQRPSN